MRLENVVLVAVMVLLASCGSSRPAYTDRVKDLNPEDAHPRFVELAKLVAGKSATETQALVTTWKRMLQDEGHSAPLSAGANYTFVYFDVSDRLDSVWMESSFSSGALIPLWRWESTRLFYRTFAVSRPDKLRYRFIASETSPDSTSLNDLLHASVDPSQPAWSVIPNPSDPQLLKVDAALEPLLAGQNLQLLLPPDYDRDVSRTWPLLVVMGQGSAAWFQVPQAGMKEGTVLPLVLVALEPRPGAAVTPTGLASYWATNLKPWLATGARVDTSPVGTFLLGWGDLARVVQETAATHPDLFGRSWSAPAGTPATDDAWSVQFSQLLKTSFAKVAP